MPEIRILFIVAAVLMSILSLVLAVRFMVPGLESTREGQAKTMANMIAISANTLASVDAGYMHRDFALREPMDVQIYEKDGLSYVKVTYDQGKSYEVPAIVKIKPLPSQKMNNLYVVKDIAGEIHLVGFEVRGAYLRSNEEVGCVEPSPEDKAAFIKAAVQEVQAGKFKYKSMVDESLVKAIINKESDFIHCKGGKITQSAKDAYGLMQLLAGTAAGLNVNYMRPQENILGGTKYIASMLDMYGGDLNLALAAYNYGNDNLDKKINQCGREWGKLFACLPKETQDFVTIVTKYRNCYSSACKPPCGKLPLC